MNKWFIMFAGIGTVFVALIMIIAIIQVFHLIFGKRPESKTKKPVQKSKTQADAPKSPTVSGPAPAAPLKPAAQAQGSSELVAVIAAAICAASGASPSSFRIASIQSTGSGEGESGFNTPVWGRIERFNR